MTLSLFRKRIRQSIANQSLQTALDNNAMHRKLGRMAAFASLPDHQARRQRAHAIKADVIANLEEYLAQFIAKVQENGITVHRAADGEEAVQIVLGITRRSEAQHAVPVVAKSKSMVSEEINLNHALDQHGIRAVETDLGEYIVQLRGERPSHIITPAVHLQRNDVGKLFQEKLGIPYTEDIPTLTAAARGVLRQVFLSADVGLSGVNFGVAETGTLCIVTNEGNGRMCTTLPPVHIALLGIERLVPSLDDLAVMLSLLARSATGQKLSVYTSLIHSPRRHGELDGPLERHLILLDNGRSAMSHTSLAESLFCIRCGACLNTCPVFREIGGHAYLGRDGFIAPYPGPIGSVVSPGLFSCENFGHLAQASSLCGACREACPVDIDLPGLLLRVRASENEKQAGIGIPLPIKLVLKAFRFATRSAGLFTAAQRLGSIFSHLYSPRSDSMRIPAFTGWGYSKDFPRLSIEPFRLRWKKVQQDIAKGQPGTQPSGNQAVASPSIFTTLIDLFTSELTLLGGTVCQVSEQALPGKLAEFLKTKGVDRVFADEVGAQYLPGFATTHEPDPSVQCGVTGALAGIAESGSLVLIGGPGRPLTASLLPAIHIAILRSSDILPTLAEALHKPELREAAAGVVVTGPSRTADIEMTLTIGVHGPGELHVFLIDDTQSV